MKPLALEKCLLGLIVCQFVLKNPQISLCRVHHKETFWGIPQREMTAVESLYYIYNQ